MKNKRAQSEVITTVLIILLVLAAVFIVYTAVMSMINKGTTTTSEKAKCMGLTLEVTGVTNNVAAVVGPPAVPAVAATVSITRKAGGDVSGVIPVILVSGVQVAGTISCTNDALDETAGGGLAELESTVCTLPVATVVTAANQVTIGGRFGTTVC